MHIKNHKHNLPNTNNNTIIHHNKKTKNTLTSTNLTNNLVPINSNHTTNNKLIPFLHLIPLPKEKQTNTFRFIPRTNYTILGCLFIHSTNLPNSFLLQQISQTITNNNNTSNNNILNKNPIRSNLFQLSTILFIQIPRNNIPNPIPNRGVVRKNCRYSNIQLLTTNTNNLTTIHNFILPQKTLENKQSRTNIHNPIPNPFHKNCTTKIHANTFPNCNTFTNKNIKQKRTNSAHSGVNTNNGTFTNPNLPNKPRTNRNAK